MAYSVQDIAKWILTRNRLEVQAEDGDYISKFLTLNCRNFCIILRDAF